MNDIIIEMMNEGLRNVTETRYTIRVGNLVYTYDPEEYIWLKRDQHLLPILVRLEDYMEATEFLSDHLNK